MIKEMKELLSEIKFFTKVIQAKGCEGCEKKGAALGAFLNRRINSMAGDDAGERAAIIGRMARAARVSVSTVNQILSGSIDCPPLARLRGFARALSVSIGSIVTAAERDGCEYDI